MASSNIACRVSSYSPFDSIAFEHVAELGLKHVEIFVPGSEALSETKTQLDRYGLSASSMHGECDVSRPDLASAIRSQMPAFAALGTKYMFVSVKAGDTPLDTAQARLREAGDMVAEHGVTIVMETHPDLMTNADVALRTMRAVEHPHVRINFDTANIYFYNQGADAVAELRECVDFVAAVHLKDTDGGYKSWAFPALGRGVVDFREVFAVLDQAGFSGPCTLEIEGFDRETRTERMVCDRIAESVGYLRGLGRL